MTPNTELTQMLAHDAYGGIQETLLFFLEECSLDEAPSDDEIRHWQHILEQRGGKFLKLAALCADHLTRSGH